MPETRRFKHSSEYPYCALDHPRPATGAYKKAYVHGYRRVSVARVTIAGYPTYLCSKCLKQWQKDWSTALEDAARTSPNWHPLLHPATHENE